MDVGIACILGSVREWFSPFSFAILKICRHWPSLHRSLNLLMFKGSGGVNLGTIMGVYLGINVDP